MASGTVIAAVIAKYGTLSAANFPDASRPSIWLDEAPQQDGAGAQLKTPYTIIRDESNDPEWTFGTNGTPGQNALLDEGFRLEVYYTSLANCNAAMAAILWNGAIPNARAGLAFATLTLDSPLKGLSVVPTKSRSEYAGFLDYQGKRVYKVWQQFKAPTALAGEGY